MFENQEIRRAPYLWRQVLTTSASCIFSVCGGLAFGVTAILLPQLRNDQDFEYDVSQDSWIASVASLAMIFGSPIAGSILDIYGRKVSQIIISIPFIIGWTCIAFANSTLWIIVGRIFTGISSGAQRPIILVYIGEIADPKFRTLALFLPGLTSHFGTLFIHLFGSYCNWRISAMICAVPSLITLVAFPFMKESPLWLISRGRIEEGAECFRWFRGTSKAAEAELASVIQRQTDEKTSTKDVMGAIFNQSFIKPFLILILTMANIQWSGANVVNFYAQDIFDKTFSGQIDPFIMMIATDCVRGFATIIVCLLAKVVPRKNTFLGCSFGIAVFLYILYAYLFFVEVGYVWIPVTCLVLYVGLSGALLSIGWTFVPEIMPSQVRGFGSGMSSAIGYLFLFIAVKITPDIINNYGESAMYASFATSSFICALFLCFLLPNTSGKTLQSIEESFQKDHKVTKQTED